jgi:hypothetical protein
MIVDIPRPADFQTAGLNQIYLAWQIAMQSLQDYDEAIAYGAEDDAENRREYWTRSQPALANAYSLIQQGMELALKGRIAAVSPLLLIGNPGDWPGRAATEDVSFGELRTLDAADLLKVQQCRHPRARRPFQGVLGGGSTRAQQDHAFGGAQVVRSRRRRARDPHRV